MLSLLNAESRRALRAQAHALKPVVWVAQNALSPAVLKEIAAALTKHELIKIRLNSDSREVRQEWITKICEETGAFWVQTIGKIVVIFKENKEKKSPAAPKTTARRPKIKKRDFQN